MPPEGVRVVGCRLCGGGTEVSRQRGPCSGPGERSLAKTAGRLRRLLSTDIREPGFGLEPDGVVAARRTPF